MKKKSNLDKKKDKKKDSIYFSKILIQHIIYFTLL